MEDGRRWTFFIPRSAVHLGQNLQSCSEEREIAITVGGQPMHFKGQQYLVGFVLPNFYFHATAAYAILRHCGLAIGKRDFMGAA